MAHFQYIALDAKGEQITGSIETGTEAEAITQIRAQGLYPTQVVEQGKGSLNAASAKGRSSAGRKAKGKTKVKRISGGKVKPKVMMIFTRQLATLIDSGLPLLKGLNVLAKQEPNPVLKSTINSIADSIQSGSTFSESLAQHPNLFNKLYVNMVKAGELGGVLEVVLTRLAEYMEKANKLKNKIVAAMVYPFIVMFIAVAILIFLMVVVVPQFKKMFDDMDQELPKISEFVFGFSDSLMSNFLFMPVVVWLVLGAMVLITLFNKWAGTVSGREKVDAFKLKMPLLGDLQRKSAISRFSRTLGTLVTSGVPILQALNITSDTAGNVVVSKAINNIHGAVKEGESIVTPMTASKVFPPMVISMVDVGEETGKLPDMLLKVADVYDDEVDNAVSALTSIIEPLMIIILAVIVGTIVIAMFLPLIKMMDSDALN
ncbi:MAG: type IV pilus assembly protein PilC [Rubritalea sp.]|jgi:type IV pilus assembly protein PilC|tara:strand:- start:2088 stop:3377 length:1290 start_codon:yes stop_codon:yes gene_type:complete